MFDATIPPEMFEVKPTNDPIYEYHHAELPNVRMEAGARNHEGLIRAAAEKAQELDRTKGRGWALYFIQPDQTAKVLVACFRRVRLPVRPLSW